MERWAGTVHYTTLATTAPSKGARGLHPHPPTLTLITPHRGRPLRSKPAASCRVRTRAGLVNRYRRATAAYAPLFPTLPLTGSHWLLLALTGSLAPDSTCTCSSRIQPDPNASRFNVLPRHLPGPHASRTLAGNGPSFPSPTPRLPLPYPRARSAPKSPVGAARH